MIDEQGQKVVHFSRRVYCCWECVLGKFEGESRENSNKKIP